MAGLLGLASSNFVSPIMEKCLDIERVLKSDNKTRMTIEEMQDVMKTDDTAIVNVQLYDCHDQRNQRFEIIDGTIKSLAVGWCLEPGRDIEKAKNVRLNKCNGEKNQQWDFTAYGYVMNQETQTCMDLQAGKKDDGSRENFHEIKAHKTVNVQLYECHDPKTTVRKNQLWEWAPVTAGVVGVGEVADKPEEKFELPSGVLGNSGFSGSAVLMASVVGSAITLAGVVVGMRVQRAQGSLLSHADE